MKGASHADESKSTGLVLRKAGVGGCLKGSGWRGIKFVQLSLYGVRLVVGSGIPIKIPALSSLSGIKCLVAVSFKTEQVNCMLDPNYHFHSLLKKIR